MSAIAIVGMACRFAGASDLHAYWQMSLEGRDAFGPVPPDRWDHDAFHSTNKRKTDRYYAPHGAFIEDVKSFPALHFGIPPRRVEVMDPQQRFSIEVNLEAIQDAGSVARDLRLTGHDVAVVAVSLDEEARFFDELRRLEKSRVTLAHAPAMAEQFDIREVPTTWIVDHTGVVRYYATGWRGAGVFERALRRAVTE